MSNTTKYPKQVVTSHYLASNLTFPFLKYYAHELPQPCIKHTRMQTPCLVSG